METTKIKNEITQIIEDHRDWHPAWILEAIEYYIKTGDNTFDPRHKKQILYNNKGEDY